MGLTICIGAGPAGLTAAYQLTRAGRDVLVLEADPAYVGGISRTAQIDGFCFDIGGHRFFSKSKDVVALWHEILGGDLRVRSRKSRIYYRGKFYPYPLNLKETLKNLGIIESVRCVLSYARARMFPVVEPKTFEEWVTNRFGERLYRIFFKTYTEKVWGMPCDAISADWAAQRIKNLSLSIAVKNALLRTLGLQGGTKVTTLIEAFFYPPKGPGMMWETAAAKIREANGRIELGSEVTGLKYDTTSQEWEVDYRAHNAEVKTLKAKYIISSMPISGLIRAMPDVPEDILYAAAQLKYRDFLIVALVLKDTQRFDDNWLYIHEPHVKVGRIQNFKAWSAEMVPDQALTCYGMEYFCFEGDGLWTSGDDALIELAKKELIELGLAARDDIIKGYVVRQPKAYPVYDRDYQRHVAALRGWLEKNCPNLQVAGRNGMHKYNNQDHSMMTAMLAVKNILADALIYDVWDVNQDAEYHEEVQQISERMVPVSLS